MCYHSYDNNQKLGGTSFKKRYKMWEKDLLVKDFSIRTAESFGLSQLCFREHILTAHSRHATWQR